MICQTDGNVSSHHPTLSCCFVFWRAVSHMENTEERSRREYRIWRNVVQSSPGFQVHRSPTQAFAARSCKPFLTAAASVCASTRGKPKSWCASLVLLETGAQQCPCVIPVQYMTKSWCLGPHFWSLDAVRKLFTMWSSLSSPPPLLYFPCFCVGGFVCLLFLSAL